MADLLYFAFGSNMLSSQMQARCPGASFHSTVRVDSYELCFPMISFTRGGMGVSSIRRNKDAYVEGIVYNLTENDIARMDRYENEGTFGLDYDPWYSRVRLQWFHRNRR